MNQQIFNKMYRSRVKDFVMYTELAYLDYAICMLKIEEQFGILMLTLILIQNIIIKPVVLYILLCYVSEEDMLHRMFTGC